MPKSTSTSQGNVIMLGYGKDCIKVKLIEGYRTKHTKIRLSATKGVELILPLNADLRKAQEFLEQNEHLIRKKLLEAQQTEPKIVIPKHLLIFGKKHELILNAKDIIEPIKLLKNQIIISHVITDKDVTTVLTEYLKILIHNEIEKYALKISKLLKVKYEKITVKEMVSKWGSSDDGKLCFSWTMVFAPKFVMEYVVAQELCRLAENNNTKYWQLMDKICPDNPLAIIWLRKNSKFLHASLK